MVIYGVTLSVNMCYLVLSHLYFTDRLDASAIANCQDGSAAVDTAVFPNLMCWNGWWVSRCFFGFVVFALLTTTTLLQTWQISSRFLGSPFAFGLKPKCLGLPRLGCPCKHLVKLGCRQRTRRPWPVLQLPFGVPGKVVLWPVSSEVQWHLLSSGLHC